MIVKIIYLGNSFSTPTTWIGRWEEHKHRGPQASFFTPRVFRAIENNGVCLVTVR